MGHPCPHNQYAQKPEVFDNRDAVMDTVERIFRLANSAELGIVSELNLDPLSVTELQTAKMELARQSEERSKKAHEKDQFDAQVNRAKEYWR